MSELNASLARQEVVAVVLRQPLRPAAGHGTPVFPATYADDKTRAIPAGYCISPLAHGGNLCVIDSVQSQAGRMEALLQQEPYRSLTRPMKVSVNTREGLVEVDVLAAAHRLFDAVFRFSSLHETIQVATRQYTGGNARPLAELAPIALICGAWDSRGEKLQIPRALAVEITARNVNVLRRAAQYTASVRAVEIEGLEESGSVEGLDHVPSHGLGGVIAEQIERRAVLSLATLRRNARAHGAPNDVLHYLWSLALVMLTMPIPPDIRSGCLLLPDGPASLRLQRADGQEEEIALDHADALALAEATAREFGVPDLPSLEGIFDPQLVKGPTETKSLKKVVKKAAKSAEPAGSGE